MYSLIYVLFIFHSTFFNSPSSRSDIYAIIEFFPIQFLPPHIFASSSILWKKKRNRTVRRNGNKIGLDIFMYIHVKRKEIYYETYFIEEMNIKMRFSWSIDENKDGKCVHVDIKINVSRFHIQFKLKIVWWKSHKQ